MKRGIDVVLSGLGLAVLCPLMVLITMLVRLESRGGALFRQTRVGRDGVEFELLKFRSMRLGPSGLAVTAADDGRITRVGRVLRSTKLDELPQLINVLRGEMSMVGPRPELPRYVALWPENARRIVLSVRPGITDPASIRFRREAELLAQADDPERYYVDVLIPEKVSLYVEYVQSRSLLGDLRLMASTLRATVVD